MFLAQAKLYAMGDYMLLPNLRDITFERPRAGLEYIGSGSAVLIPLVDLRLCEHSQTTRQGGAAAEIDDNVHCHKPLPLGRWKGY